MSKVIAAIDMSAAAGPVLAMARAFARVLGADVEAIHVDDEPGCTVVGTAAFYDLPLTIVGGEPLDALARVADDEEVVSFVLGTRAHPLGRRPAGHVTIALADRVDKSVLIVPPDATMTPELRRMVIAMRGTPGEERTFTPIVELASAAELDLTVVHVDDADTIPFSSRAQYEMNSNGREFLARYCLGAREARLELRTGLPWEEILSTVDQAHADVLTIGWPHTPEAGRGSVARELLARSRTPVLLVATA